MFDLRFQPKTIGCLLSRLLTTGLPDLTSLLRSSALRDVRSSLTAIFTDIHALDDIRSTANFCREPCNYVNSTLK